MATAVSTITIVHPRGEDTASVIDRMQLDASASKESVQRMSSELAAIAGGARSGKVSLRVDGSTGAQASGTIAVTQADCTAGDTITITLPSGQTYTLTAVAGSATAANGEYSIDTSDTAVGVSIDAAVDAYRDLAKHVTASNSSGTVTLTAVKAGSAGNNIRFTSTETTATALVFTAMSGGADPGASATQTITCGAPDIVADDTVSIGSLTLTWKASASSQDEVTLSTTPATAATNLGAAINAHTSLQGLVSASVASAVVTVTWLGAPRAGQLVTLARAETNAGSVVLGAAALASASTESLGSTSTVTYAGGAA